MYNPLVSIVIPAYNASNYLEEAVNSALAQTYKNIEIIVVNDGSKDDGATRRVAEKFGKKIIYVEKENGGSSSALNTGIKNMKGEWFSWLSHDDLYMPEKIEKQMEYINSLGLCGEELYGNVFFSAAMLVDANGDTIRMPKASFVKSMFADVRSIKGNEYLIAEPTKYCYHGCTCLIHKSVFEKIGAFDEELRFLNDVDLWFRIYSAGYKLNYIPAVLVKGRVHEKQVSRSISFSYHNTEQDMYWKRSLDWLMTNCPDNYELYYRFGRNAFKKTRFEDGERAFGYAVKLNPKKKTVLGVKKTYYKVYANLRALAKNIYLRFKA